MQPVPGCRIRVWKKEWQQTVGSQTSLTTGTRRIAKRIEPRSRREKRRGGKEREQGKVWEKYWKKEKRVERQNVKGQERRWNGKNEEEIEKRRGGM